ncbi:MAG TPA: hypothetical protein DEH78_23180 [Solibacterales bacterium]|nr:hypothetical protein [Bryobacterales bacterium]
MAEREVRAMSADGHVLDVARAVPGLNRQRAKAILDGYAGEWKSTSSGLRRVTVAEDLGAVVALIRGSECRPPEAMEARDLEAMNGAQLVRFGGSGRGWMKFGWMQDSFAVDGGDGEVGFRLPGSQVFALSSFHFRDAVGGKAEELTVWLFGKRLPPNAEAEAVTRQVISSTGISRTTVVFRQDYFFESWGGPRFDVFRGPLPAPLAHYERRYLFCVNAAGLTVTCSAKYDGKCEYVYPGVVM